MEIGYDQVVADLKEAAPRVTETLFELADRWLGPAQARLEREGLPSSKIIADPIWGVIELTPYEVVLLDSQLIQRLRRVKQLGLASLVYPAATHDRLSHTLGVLEASHRILQSIRAFIARAADGFYGERVKIPGIEDEDEAAIRIAALLHDTGHSCFSHAAEPVLESLIGDELWPLHAFIALTFKQSEPPGAAELISFLLSLSPALSSILQHRKFEITQKKESLALRVAARIIGSREFVECGYLSNVISGPIDADKIDYIARDNYFSGFPIAADTERLIKRIRVIRITEENTPSPHFYAQNVKDKPDALSFVLGIFPAAASAFDQFILARVFLFDRLYYHHKVRAAESMLMELLRSAARGDSGYTRYSIGEMLESGDDEILSNLMFDEDESDKAASSTNYASRLLARDLFKRAFVCGKDHIKISESMNPEDVKILKSRLWNRVLTDIIADRGDAEGRESRLDVLRGRIVEIANKLRECLDEFKNLRDIATGDAMLDFPKQQRMVAPKEIAIQGTSGKVSGGRLLFKADEWAEAYASRRQVLYVFSDREVVNAVYVACQIVFADRYGLVLSREALDWLKTDVDLGKEWVEKVAGLGLCSAAATALLQKGIVSKVRFQASDLVVEREIEESNPEFANEIATALNDILSAGVPGRVMEDMIEVFSALLAWRLACDKTGVFARVAIQEKDLQQRLLFDLRQLGKDVVEGERLTGGPCDLVYRSLVIENKTLKEADDPRSIALGAAKQADRYSEGLCRHVTFSVVGYKPRANKAFLSAEKSVTVVKVEKLDEPGVQIRLFVPYDYGIPSKVK